MEDEMILYKITDAVYAVSIWKTMQTSPAYTRALYGLDIERVDESSMDFDLKANAILI